MEFLLNRYRNLTVLLIVIVAQLALIAYQVKTSKDVPLIRVWAVTAVAPVEQALEFTRRNTVGRVEEYFFLLGVKGDNERLRGEVGRLKLDNQYLRTELNTADRLRALGAFQAHSPSKMLSARIIGTGAGANSRVVFVDRGAAGGVESGMAVITPDGIVGKVVDSYPTASMVMLVTDPAFAAGVISQKNRAHGALKGLGHGNCLVDYVQNEQKVDVGEWFYTSGDDRIFPKGLPAGQAVAAKNGKSFKEIYVTPAGLQGGLEEVLIVIEGVHQAIPENEIASPLYKLLPAPPAAAGDRPDSPRADAALATDADRLKEQYKLAGAAEKHAFGAAGSTVPDFRKLGAAAPGPQARTEQARPELRPPAVTRAGPPGAVAPKPSGAPAPAPLAAQAAATPGSRRVAKSAAAPPPGAAAAPGSEPAATPKRPSGPILVTDPADADPEAAPPPARLRPKPKTPPPAP